MKKRLLFILVVFANLVWLGCGSPEKKNDDRVAEGVINYDAEPVDSSSPMAEMAPNKMTVKFKNNKTVVQMSAGMGFVTMAFISDTESKTFTQMLKLTGTSWKVVTQNEEELKKENELFNLEVIPTNQTKMIAGYNCKKARVHYKGGELTDYDIYYTTDLNIKNSNFANPYYKLDGVLMEYRVKKAGLEMQFVATSVTKEPVEDSAFEIPLDHKVVSLEEMNDLFLSLQ